MPQIRLTPEDAQRLHQLQADLAELDLDIQRAARAGIDVTQHQEKLSQVKKLREGVLREFSPGTRHIGSPHSGG